MAASRALRSAGILPAVPRASLPSAAGGTPAGQPPGRRRYTTSTGHSHPLQHCPASHTLQRRHLAGCPEGILPSAAGGRRRTAAGTAALPYSQPGTPIRCTLPGIARSPAPASCRRPEGISALGGGRDARRTAAGTAALRYINHTASTSTITCVPWDLLLCRVRQHCPQQRVQLLAAGGLQHESDSDSRASVARWARPPGPRTRIPSCRVFSNHFPRIPDQRNASSSLSLRTSTLARALYGG